MDHQYRQRPPSARPGTRQQQSRIGTTSTTQRRPKTAGRNSERPFTPSSNSFGPIPPSRQMSITPQTASGRPQSRIGMVANSIVSSTLPPSRSGSRIGTTSIVGTPGTAFGNRLNRSTTSMGQRPGTIGRQMIVNQIPLGTAQQRPITQQGVSGARAAVIASRMGSNRIGTSIGGGRMIADTNYYLGLLHNKLNILDNELINLNTELNKAEKGKKNLLIYEQKAEEQAQELKQLQGLLADYNLIIDRQNTHSNTNLRSLDSEAEQIALTNQKLMVEVEELFNERRLREEQVQELEQRTERLKNENNERMRILEKEIKEEFEQVNIEVENLRNEMERKKIELAELTKNKEEMDMALANSPFKRQTMLMEEQLQELNNKRTQIIDELNSKETPEEQRDNFIQKIQKDNKEIGNMQEQLQEINERMSQAQEELQEFQNEFELLAGDKSEKFRELKNRGAQMDNFLDNFDESKKQIEERINILSRQIIRQLQLISLNCRHGEIITNITGLDESLLALGSSSVNANELQELHVRLQEELINLNQNKTLLNSELISIKTKQKEINENLNKMDNIEDKKKEFRIKIREIESKKDNLKEELNRLETENEKLKIQIKSEENRFIGENYEMIKLRELKTNVDQIELIRKELDEKLNELRNKLDYGPFKQKVLELRTEYNELLINNLLNRKNVAK